jgi:hypothetical protein
MGSIAATPAHRARALSFVLSRLVLARRDSARTG